MFVFFKKIRMETLGIGSRVNHPHYGKGVVVEAASEFYLIWFKTANTAKNISKEYTELTVLENSGSTDAGTGISLADIEQALDSVLTQRLHEFQLVPMATKWNDGTMILKPGDDSLQSKEVPVDVFFHKIVMVRDRLRLIEQKINSLDQAAPLQGWDLPEEFATLRRVMEGRMAKHGRREYVQVLRLLESFDLADLHAAVKQALQLGAIGFDAVKHLILCRVERRPPRLDLSIYPFLPRATVETTSVKAYMRLLSAHGEEAA